MIIYFSLSSIFHFASVAFQEVCQIIDMMSTMHYDNVCLIALWVLDIVSEWEILMQYLQVCGLLHPVDWGMEGCVISLACSSREVGLLSEIINLSFSKILMVLDLCRLGQCLERILLKLGLA